MKRIRSFVLLLSVVIFTKNVIAQTNVVCFKETCRDYVGFLEQKRDSLASLNDLNVILSKLPLLKLDDGWVLDNYCYTDQSNYILRLYARPDTIPHVTNKQFSDLMEIVRAQQNEGEILFPKNPDFENRTLRKKCLETELFDIHYYDYGLGVPKVEFVFDHLSLPFTAEAIWQAYLLELTFRFYGFRWHGGYQHRVMIFDRQDYERIPVWKYGKDISELKDEEYWPGEYVDKQKLDSCWQETYQPSVTFDGDTAVISHCWWNDKRGLERLIVIACYDFETQRIKWFRIKSIETVFEYNDYSVY